MTPRRILVGGWLVFLLYAYPGYMMTEAADQIIDGRYGHFTDWHSVIMSEIWRTVAHVIEGPAGMLFLQSLLLLVGCYHIMRRIVGERAAAWVSVAVLLVPPVIATSAVICAEAQLAGWLVGGMAALLSERFRIRLVGVGLLGIACGMRDGASVAVLPIMLATFTWYTPQPRWRRIGIAAVAWVAVVLAAGGIERVLVDAPSERQHVRLATTDIVGTLRYAGTVTDSEIKELLPDVRLAVTAEIQQHARDAYGKGDYLGGDRRVFERPETQSERDRLYAGRRNVIRARPGAYLDHRWHQFWRALVLPTSSTNVYTQFAASEGEMEAMSHSARHSLVQRILIAPVEALGTTIVFHPAVYFVLGLLLLPLVIVRKETILLIVLASGLVYELTLFFVATRAEYRDSHPMIVATLLTSFALVSQRVTATLEARHERIDREAAIGVAGDDDIER